MWCVSALWGVSIYVQVCTSMNTYVCGFVCAGVCACMCVIGPYSMMHRKNKPESNVKFLWEHVGGSRKWKGTLKATLLYSFWVEPCKLNKRRGKATPRLRVNRNRSAQPSCKHGLSVQ